MGTLQLIERAEKLFNSKPKIKPAGSIPDIISLGKSVFGSSWKDGKHITLLNKVLHEVIEGKVKRLAIMMPPRHAKTTMACQLFVPVFLAKQKDKRVIYTTYEASKAAEWGRKSRDIIEQYSDTLGIQLRSDSRASNKWDIAGHRGGMLTAGAGGPLVGSGADVLICDDLLKNNEEADSPVMREKLVDWLGSTAMTRLEPGGAVIMIMHRWRRDDIMGTTLQKAKENGEEWTVLKLPVLADGDDVLGRKPGEVLWPERFSQQEMEERKRTTAPRWWFSLYQQDPQLEEGAEWPADWFTDVWVDDFPKPNDCQIKVLSLDPSKGKALALDTPIPTPTGWTTMGQLKVGDNVYAEDGTETNVTWVSPVWKDRKVYRLVSDTGGSIIADEEHLWKVRLRRPMKSMGYDSVYSLRKTADLVRRQDEMVEFRKPLIDCNAGLDIPDVDLPVPPYTLGAWIGDGNRCDGRIAQTPEDGVWLFERIRAEGFETKHYGGIDWRVFGLRTLLRKAGLLKNKHIPRIYFRASKSQRLALLHGLIDTDGYVSKAGQVEFVSVNKSLANDTKELLATLGVKSGIKEKIVEYRGRKIVVYRVRFYFEHAASMPRKAMNCKQMRSMGHYVVFEDAGIADTVCIEIDHPSHMFLAGKEMIPTHNSDKRGDYSAYVMLVRGKDGLVYVGADMCNRRHAEKIVHDGLQLIQKHKPDAFVIESNASQDLFGLLFQNESRIQRVYIRFDAESMVDGPVFLKEEHFQSKVGRIRSWGKWFGRREVRFVRSMPQTQLLLDQFMMFPTGGNDPGVDDGPDSAAMALKTALEISYHPELLRTR